MSQDCHIIIIRLAARFCYHYEHKANLRYPVCKACLLHATSIFPWGWFACGINHVKYTCISNMDGTYSYRIPHCLLNAVKWCYFFLIHC